MSKQIGYARVSKTPQATDRQVAALKDAGCEVVYNEVISNRTSEGDRPQLQACLASLNEGDDISPRSRDASVNRFLTRLGTFLNNDVALTPMECLQRIYIIYDEEVNAK